MASSFNELRTRLTQRAELTEAPEKHAVLAFGRMNPPTTGHAKLVNKVHELAKAHNAHHTVVLSHSHDPKKNPLSATHKVKHAKRFFPGTNISAASKEHPTIFHHAAELHKQGYTHLHIVAGADRLKEFHKSFHAMNGKKVKDGPSFHFKNIKLHSSGDRSAHSKGVEGMSASKMRGHASAGHFSEFRKGIPSHVSHAHARELYHDVRKSMGHLEEEVEVLEEGVHDAAIFKAVFLAGGPGSGKDFVLKKALDGHGMVEINADSVEEILTKKKADDPTKRAKSIAELRQRLAVQGRNGIIINSTGHNPTQIKALKKQLEAIGYDTAMVFVDTSDNISRNRNVERGQNGGRSIPEKTRAEKWRQAQDARVEFSKVFGQGNYHEFNNDEDLRFNTDGEIHKQKTTELEDLFKQMRKFTQTPPKNEVAQQWVQTNLGKLAKKPVGNKQQQRNYTPAADNSQSTEEARKLGLQYYGYGRWGKNGRVTHFSLHGKLVEKQKALKPLEKKDEKKPAKKLNEEFEALLKEESHEPDNESISVEDRVLVGEAEIESLVNEGRLLLPCDGRELSDFGRTCGTETQENTQTTCQEKKGFQDFQLGLIQEAEKLPIWPPVAISRHGGATYLIQRDTNRVVRITGPWRPGSVWKADSYNVKPEFHQAYADKRVTTRERGTNPTMDSIFAAMSLGQSNDIAPELLNGYSDCLGYKFSSKKEAMDAAGAYFKTPATPPKKAGKNSKVLKEGEPVADISGEGSPLSSASTPETIDTSAGGAASPGVKKTLKDFKKRSQ